MFFYFLKNIFFKALEADIVIDREVERLYNELTNGQSSDCLEFYPLFYKLANVINFERLPADKTKANFLRMIAEKRIELTFDLPDDNFEEKQIKFEALQNLKYLANGTDEEKEV
jgi:hypothetical protein